MLNRDDVIKEGYKYYCVGCNTVYKVLPTQIYEDGHGGRHKAFCKRCECDLFANLLDDKRVEEYN